MIYSRVVTECDFTGTKYATPVAGAAFVAQGATGRWCEVMHAGPEYLAENGYGDVFTYEEARAACEKVGGYCDF